MNQRRPVLGVITNDRHQVFQSSVITGLEEVAEAQGYDVIVDSIAEDPLNPRPVSLDMASMAGVLVIANVLSDAALGELHETDLPISLVSHYVPAVPIPSVVSDNTQGIAQLVGYLVKRCGCQRIAFVRGNMAQRDGIKRDQAFQQELIRHDLEIYPDLFLDGDFDPQVAAENFREFLRSGTRFDAVLASDYLMAVAVVELLRSTGIRVPQDVNVVGFGDGPESAEAGLTTVAADIRDVGRRGARQLIGQIEGLRIQGLTILSTTLVERETCQPITLSSD
jgi:DNA-binding LacI/PurR family transcriptional regulator